MKTALFPISVDNSKFTTSFFSRILRPVADQYDELVFLVADELQLYNKACEVGKRTGLKEVLSEFTEKNRYFDERKRWLQKVVAETGIQSKGVQWKFKGLADITDHAFYEIYRNVTLAFHTVHAFRRDVLEDAERYCRKKPTRVSPEIEQRLSEAYILEEIAVNIRLRVCENISHEYYPFGYFKPIMRVYSDDYGFTAFDLAGVTSQHCEFSFFQWNDVHGAWELASPPATGVCSPV